MAKTKIEKEWDRQQLEAICKRYHNTPDAAQAAGMSQGGFARVCKRLSILTPGQRKELQRQGTKGHPLIKRSSHLWRFKATYLAMGIEVTVEWLSANEVFYVYLTNVTDPKRISGITRLCFNRYGAFVSQESRG